MKKDQIETRAVHVSKKLSKSRCGAEAKSLHHLVWQDKGAAIVTMHLFGSIVVRYIHYLP